MLQNAYFLAKIGADTAENEKHFAEILPKTSKYPTGRRATQTAPRESASSCAVTSGLPAGAFVDSGSISNSDFSAKWSNLIGLVLLYRRQILQENIRWNSYLFRWKALDEIYKIYMLLHRSDLDISENFRQTSFAFFAKLILQISLFLNSFRWFLLRFWWNFVEISPIS